MSGKVGDDDKWRLIINAQGKREFNKGDYNKFDKSARTALWEHLECLNVYRLISELNVEDYCEPDLRVLHVPTNTEVGFEIEVSRHFKAIRNSVGKSDGTFKFFTIPYRKYKNGTLEKSDFYVFMDEDFTEAVVIPKKIYEKHYQDTISKTWGEFSELFIKIPSRDVSRSYFTPLKKST